MDTWNADLDLKSASAPVCCISLSLSLSLSPSLYLSLSLSLPSLPRSLSLSLSLSLSPLLHILLRGIVLDLVMGQNPKIRRPRPSPRPGRRLGPPQVWNFSFLAFQGQTTSRKPSPGHACAGFTCARPSARALNVQAAGQHLAGISCTPYGRPYPAHPSRQLPPSSWPSAFQHCSLPFACT